MATSMDVAAPFDYAATVDSGNTVNALQLLIREVKRMNDNIEGMSKYTTTVISPTMKDVDDTLVVVKSEVKRIGDRTDMLHLLNFGSAISELEKKVTHLEGFSMRVENVQSAINDALKDELSH